MENRLLSRLCERYLAGETSLSDEQVLRNALRHIDSESISPEMQAVKAMLEVADERHAERTAERGEHHGLEDELPEVKNFNISVKKRGSDMIFLRKIVPGAADRSYGVEVAKLAGLPDKVVSRARAVLRELEAGAVQTAAAPVPAAEDQISMMDMDAIAIRDKLAQISVETMTPIEAMNALYQLKMMIK